MNPKTPAMAGWLLKRFGIPQRNESLMGDLVEEYGSGRSALWFWRQTAVAIGTRVGRDLGSHKLLALRAMAVGWLLNVAGGQIEGHAKTVCYLRHWVSAFEVIMLLSVSLFPALVGWGVARMHRAQQAAMVLAFVASEMIWAIGYYSVNYAAIERMHPPSVSGIYFLLVCSMLACTLIGGFLQKPRERAAEPRAE
jgi:cation transport ATPase